MQAEMEIYGEDVIGRPGQTLSRAELRVLVGLADGETPNAICKAVGVDIGAIRHYESSIKAKLGAKTHPHMIARGFTLGVLFPRALCILLALAAATEHLADANRNSSRRNGRSNPLNRMVRDIGARKGTGGRDATDAVHSGVLYSQIAYNIRTASANDSTPQAPLHRPALS